MNNEQDSWNPGTYTIPYCDFPIENNKIKYYFKYYTFQNVLPNSVAQLVYSVNNVMGLNSPGTFIIFTFLKFVL